MKIAGIIAEYNPFHKGHRYQLTYTKENLKADYVIIAMSGDYVQRGVPALLPKHLRAEMALRCGADLVLELPTAFATASAEFFAKGGVELLDSLGVVDSLCFGSESGEITMLMELAKLLIKEPDEYRELLKGFLSRGLSFPAARSQAVLAYFGNPDNSAEISPSFPPEIHRILASPNNILGIEYCKALLRLNSRITPVTLRREGSGYHDENLSPEKYASAAAIRKLLLEAPDASALSEEALRQQLEALVPEQVFALLGNSLGKNAFVTEKDLDSILHYCLLSQDCYKNFPDVSDDLSRRFLNRRNQYEGFARFASLLKTKEVTQTRIQRALLHILLNIREIPESVPYARVLGFRKASSPLLKEIKANSRIPLLTKLADASALLDEQGLAVLGQDTFASNLYEGILSRKEDRKFVHEYEKKIVIL